MELKTAIEILEYHQEWRVGKRGYMRYNPNTLTKALDIVLEEVKQPKSYSMDDIVKCIEHWGLCKVEAPYIETFLNKNK